jgi:hypothetical protein
VQDTEKENKEVSKNGILIEWVKNGNLKYENIILLSDKEYFMFNSTLKNRIDRLKTKFNFFQEDMNKSNQFQSLKLSSEEIINLIEHREALYFKNKMDHELKDLMLLYQKLIEMHSDKNSEEYRIYINKLQNLLESSKPRNK